MNADDSEITHNISLNVTGLYIDEMQMPDKQNPPPNFDDDYGDELPVNEKPPSLLSKLNGAFITNPLSYLRSQANRKFHMEKLKYHNSFQSPNYDFANMSLDDMRIKRRLLELTKNYQQLSEDEQTFSPMDIKLTDMLCDKENAEFWRAVKGKRQFFSNKSEAIFDVYCDLLINKAGGPNAALIKILSMDNINELTVNLFVYKLLEHGASPFCVDSHDNTPLHLVVKNGHAQVAKQLLENLAISYAPNTALTTPLELAIDNNDDVMGEMIVRSMPPPEVSEI